MRMEDPTSETREIVAKNYETYLAAKKDIRHVLSDLVYGRTPVAMALGELNGHLNQMWAASTGSLKAALKDRRNQT